MKFSEKEDCNKDLVALGALLHDVDDYKIFGSKNQEELINTHFILDQLNLSDKTKEEVLEIVGKIGYSKALKGIRPTTIKGMIVSDADMCDASGAIGILRTHQYSIQKGKEFFNKTIWPIESVEANKYTREVAVTSVCHMFEKVLKLKNLMMTEAGKQEAIKRHNFVISFLKQLFKEENAIDWQYYLENYLKNI